MPTGIYKRKTGFKEKYKKFIDANKHDKKKCWVWWGAKTKAGYPLLCKDGKQITLHRYSWSDYNKKEIEKGKVIRHKCDNPGCINPHHLAIGTYKDNTRDMYERGRNHHKGAPGEKHGCSKLKDNDIYEIRKLKDKMTTKELSKKYNVTATNIRYIKSNKTWKHLLSSAN